jgi:thiol:disulfide interchange protein DsbA
MKRKLLLGVLITIVVLSASAFALKIWADQGNDALVDMDASLVKSKKPRVVEFFLYSCPHCYSLEPTLERWLDVNREGVEFVKVPAVTLSSWLPYTSTAWTWAKTYYALEKMGQIDHMHKRIFDAIQIDKIDLSTKEKMSSYLAAQGIDAKAFEQHFDSDEVMQKVLAAKNYFSKYKVRMTPTFIVNDHFRTSISMAAYSVSEMMRNVDNFVAQSRME